MNSYCLDLKKKSKVFLDHQNFFFSLTVGTILKKKTQFLIPAQRISTTKDMLKKKLYAKAEFRQTRMIKESRCIVMFCYNSNSSTSNPLAADIWNFVIVFNCTKSWKTRMKVFLSYRLRNYLNFNNRIGPNKRFGACW